MTMGARGRTGDTGFTLIEVAVAMLLLMVAATGVAQLFGIAISAAESARVQTSATLLAIQKLEQLRALAWTTDASGAPLSDRDTDVAVVPTTSGGPGLNASSPNSLDVNTPGYVDYLSTRGVWLGAGPVPPRQARYIRRWSVQSLPEDPADTLILQVLVTTVARDARALTPRRRLQGDALVTTVLTRKAP